MTKKYILIYFGFISLLLSCKTKKVEASKKCHLKPDAGPCEAYIPKYYFDKTEQKCKEFIWGGCDGVVPFDTLEECEACDCKSF